MEDAPELPEVDLSASLAELQELLEQPVVVVPGPPPATLTEISGEPASVLPLGFVVAPIDRSTPAAVMRIDYDMIWGSGARRLTELFDIYVPNTQLVRHHFSFEHVTPRGLVSDLEDKYLFQVNGRTMNQLTITGAFSEVRDLPLLGDIHHVDFIRGPGSALYGPGAISGVISVVTHSAMTFEGTDVTFRQGAIDTFSAVELRHGRKFSDDCGVFVYFGLADYHGASYADAPLVFSNSFATPASIPDVVAGRPTVVPDTFDQDRRSWRGRAKMKLHAQYTKGDFDFWVRYTQGGEKGTPPRGQFALPPIGGQAPDFDYDTIDSFQFGYVQFTALGRYLWELNECLSADMRLSYDTMDFVRIGYDGEITTPHREEEYYGRLLLNWTPVESQAVAAGAEVSRGVFGLPTCSFPDVPPETIIIGDSGIPWYTTWYAFLAEHQWKINDCWTTFLTGRWDKHTFTDWLFSPRAAVVHTPDEVNTLKFIATESVRRQPEDGLRSVFDATGTFADTESIQSYELRYERRPCDHWMVALSGFYQDSAFVGFTGNFTGVPSGQDQFANVTTWGLELEAIYRTQRNRIVASQSYTQLIDFELTGPFALPDDLDLTDPFFIQGFSAAPYGYGNDLGNYSPHLTKLAFHHEHDCQWTSDMSLRVYWGFPGDRDLTDFNNDYFAANGSPLGLLGLSDPGVDKAFHANAYLNYGLEYRPFNRLIARLDLFNILGWLDTDLNKRNFIFESSTYRSEAAAMGVSVRWER
jgi:iron complex outermembrane receptor protein